MARSLIPRRRSDRSDVATLLDRFWNEPLTPRTLWGDLTATDIRVDMYEEDDTVVVEAEVPGLAREDLHLEIHGDELRIWGERKDKREHEDERVFLRESRYGRIERRMLLPHDVDADAATAKVENGVLTLRLPVADAPTHHEIPIEEHDD